MWKGVMGGEVGGVGVGGCVGGEWWLWGECMCSGSGGVYVGVVVVVACMYV